MNVTRVTVSIGVFFLSHAGWAAAPAKGHDLNKPVVLEQDEAPPLDKFPCNLPKDRPLSKIVLMGEQHHTPDAEDSKFEVLYGASRGKCVVGLEGTICDATDIDPFAKVFKLTKDEVDGINEPLTSGLAALLALHNSVASAERSKDREDRKISVMKYFEQNPLMKVSWDIAFKKMKPFLERDPSEKTIAKLIDNISGKSAKEVDDILKDFPEVWTTDNLAFGAVLKAWIRSYVDMALSAPYKKKHYVPNNARELVEAALNGTDVLSVIKTLVVAWQDQFMAQNIAKIYCRIARGGKDLHILVGSLHLPGIKKYLDNMSDKAVKVTTALDRQEKWIKEIRKELADKKKEFDLKDSPFGKTPQMQDFPLELAKESIETKSTIVMRKNGVTYTLQLHTHRDPLLGLGNQWEAGEISITAPGAEKDGRLKFFLGELENAATTDKEVAKAIAGLKLPAATSIKTEAISGQAESGFTRIPAPKSK